MGKFKSYSNYASTDCDWLNDVPSHWAQTPLRSITKLSSKRNGNEGSLELLSVYREYGVIKKSSRHDNHNVESADLSSYKFVDKGYLVMNKMKMWQGSLGVSKYQGIVSPAYIICRLNGTLNPYYINYLLRSANYKTIYNRLSYGVRVGQWDMRYDDFKNIKAILPPKEEQDQIARYLDSKLAKINKFIKNKKRLVGLLIEQKQAVINQAVTKGLDPAVKMKPSGVEWLGDVPEGWEIITLKHLTSINKDNLSSNNDSHQVINYIDISTVGFAELKQSPVQYIFSEAPSRARRVVHNGDTIISTVRTYLKSIVYIDESLDGFIASTGFAVLTPSKLVSNRLLNYILSADYFLNSVAKYSIGVSYPAISETVLSRLKVVIPNNMDEQHIILSHVIEKTKTIDQTIDRINKEIDLITEYRTSLISAVVTGKVDVRGIAVKEPPAEDLADPDLDDIEDEELREDDLLESEVG